MFDRENAAMLCPPMNKRRAEKWAVIRAKGRGRYILVNGVLLWGILTGVLWSIIMSALQGWHSLSFFLPTALIIFPVCGYFFGAWTWKKTEGEYQKSISQPFSD
jgi:hypothetical protein